MSLRGAYDRSPRNTLANRCGTLSRGMPTPLDNPDPPAGPMARPLSRPLLLLVSLYSLTLVTSVNSTAAYFLPGIAGLADSCAASLLVCYALYRAIDPALPFAPPQPNTNWRRVMRLSALWLGLWLAGSALAAILAGHWIRYGLTYTVPQLAAFLLLAPLQEELLFRGSIFELTQRITTNRLMPIWVSAILFSLHHLQLHGFHFTPAAWLQLGFTLPLGVILGILRTESRSLWPGLSLHILTNIPGIFGS